ncbi:PilZ domain-containing protein [Thiorhodococcus minor]|uniref:PilZ domain-containing protein n=1 Tax=Thiorhodococcus minor TaxID=57489 RepID=A0A6M0K2R6_9GAMM|nr:PilZ domain-containing protein [Thiorhodococcus minor]NEV63679.1 PilZ domain-containing protein [Thiorhodococcus minor]
MTIEHRYCARYPTELEVHISYRKRRFISAKGTNLSNHGMFLQVRNLTLPTGTMVDLELHALGRGWLIPAVVVHRGATGIGVMFRELQAELFQGLPQFPEQPAFPSAQVVSSMRQISA